MAKSDLLKGRLWNQESLGTHFSGPSDYFCKLGNRLPREDVTRRQAHALLTRTRHHLDTQNRVPAQLKKVVIDADPLQPQDLSPS